MLSWIRTIKKRHMLQAISGEEERTFERLVKEIVSQSMIQDRGGSTHDA